LLDRPNPTQNGSESRLRLLQREPLNVARRVATYEWRAIMPQGRRTFLPR